MLKRLTFILATLPLATHAMADVDTNNLYIPFGAMYYHLNGDRNIENTFLPEVGLGYRIDDTWAVEGMYAKRSTESTGSVVRTNVDLSQARIDVLHFYNNWNGLTPYAVIGLGKNDYDASSALLKRDDDTLLNFGVGLSKEFNDNWSARADIRDIQSLQENVNEYAVNLMVQYRFGTSSKAAMAAPEPAPMPPVARVETPAPVQHAALPAKVEISLLVNFDTDSSVVKPEYDSEIKRVADFISEYPNIKVTIEGYTDNRGKAAHNQKLSENRAKAICTVLSTKYGANTSRLQAVGYGESKPIADNKTSEGRRQNRRVVAVMSN